MKMMFLILAISSIPLSVWASCPDTPTDCYEIVTCVNGEEGSCRLAIDTSRGAVSQTYLASSDGDGVYLPSGTSVWSGKIIVETSVTVMGNTVVDTDLETYTDNTIISAEGGAFAVQTSDVRITGITFSGSASSNNYGMVDFHRTGGGLSNFRIDHCHFAGTGGDRYRDITIGRYNSASENIRNNYPVLIDNNRFSNSEQHKSVEVYGSGGEFNAWNEPLDLGGSEWAFIEDNWFIFDAFTVGESTIDTDSGGRLVFRHNRLHNGWLASHGIEQAAPASMPWRSTHGFEIYNNIFTSDGFGNFRINIRGGTGVIFDNSWNGDEEHYGARPIRYYYERGDDPRTCLGSSACDGDYPYDGNQPGHHGYMCYQQIGATGPSGIESLPVYQWGNEWNGAADESRLSGITHYDECGYQHVQFDRDIILNGSTPKPGYSSFPYPHPFRTEVSCTELDGLCCLGEQTCEGGDFVASMDCGAQCCTGSCGEAAVTCTSEGYLCCDECDDTAQSELDSSCGDRVCCEACQASTFAVEECVEAEAGELVAPMMQHVDDTAEGGYHVATPTMDQGSVTFTFHIPEDGSYVLDVLARTSDITGGSNSFYVYLDHEDGQGNSQYAYQMAEGLEFSWDRVNRAGNGTTAPEFDPMIWELETGTHSFVFFGREENTQLDQVALRSCADADCSDMDALGCHACVGGSSKSCYDGPDGTEGVGACVTGEQQCEEGAWGLCESQTLPTLEDCTDDVDNDCDGLIDDLDRLDCPSEDVIEIIDETAGCSCRNMPGGSIVLIDLLLSLVS